MLLLIVITALLDLCFGKAVECRGCGRVERLSRPERQLEALGWKATPDGNLAMCARCQGRAATFLSRLEAQRARAAATPGSPDGAQIAA